jgi:hypothetical protein
MNSGSECVGLSGVSDDGLLETSHVNKSLSALSDVLKALKEKATHIPYRNSKLTQLMKVRVEGWNIFCLTFMAWKTSP